MLLLVVILSICLLRVYRGNTVQHSAVFCCKCKQVEKTALRCRRVYAQTKKSKSSPPLAVAGEHKGHASDLIRTSYLPLKGTELARLLSLPGVNDVRIISHLSIGSSNLERIDAQRFAYATFRGNVFFIPYVDACRYLG